MGVRYFPPIYNYIQVGNSAGYAIFHLYIGGIQRGGTQIYTGAHQLIRQQHPQQQGLLCTLLLQSPDKLPKLPPDSIQIHHVAGNHWVCSKNCGTHIKLFDSLYNGWLATDLNTQLQALYLTNEGSLEVRVQRVQQQQGGTDCGLFAIAYALSLAPGEDPTRIKFKQGNMRQHLIDCLHHATISSRENSNQSSTSRQCND